MKEPSLSMASRLARRLDVLGSSLATASGVESSSVSLRSLKETLPQAFSLLADVVRHPRFAEEDFERERNRLRAELAHRHKQPSAQADEAIEALVYGPSHPYGRPSDGTEEGLSNLTPADLAAFHRSYYRPEAANLLVAGDATLEEIEALVNTHFEGWGSDESPMSQATWLPFAAYGPTVRIIERPGAAQSVLRIACRSVQRSRRRTLRFWC